MRRFWLSVVVLCLTATVGFSDVRRRFIATGPPPSTFPQVRALATSIDNTNNTTLIHDLPANIVSGELLLCAVFQGGRRNADWPTGWIELRQQRPGLGDLTGHLGYRIADGTEGATVTITLTNGSAQGGAAFCWAINNWHGVEEPDWADAPGSTGTPTPPQLTVGWGAADNLWLVAAGTEAGRTVTDYPLNYDDNQSSTTGGGVTVGSATRELNAATEQPGTFVWTGSGPHLTFTVGVRP